MELEALAMNTAKRKRKKAECKKHREVVHEYAMDAVIKLIHGEKGGKPPEYLHEGFLKLKEVR